MTAETPLSGQLQTLLDDFFTRDSLAALAADAGRLLRCPLMLLDNTFHIVSHHTSPGFADPVFVHAVNRGEVTCEAVTFLHENTMLAAGQPVWTALEDSPLRRRFSLLVSSGVRLGYLVCVDADGLLEQTPPETFAAVERVLAKQLFMEASRQDKPFGTAEELLMHLLDGGFTSEPYFRLQISSTYLADFHPAAFALIDLAAYHSLYLGKNQLRDELNYRFYASHPFLYQGDVFLFLHRDHDLSALSDLAEEFHLKVIVSEPIGTLFGLPALYRTAREALSLLTDGTLHSSSVFSVPQLSTAVLLSALQKHRALIDPAVLSLAALDVEKGSQYCETLFRYLSCGRSPQETSQVLFTHRNTVLYRIRRMKEDLGVPLDDPTAHLRLLLSAALVLFSVKGADFFVQNAPLLADDEHGR